MPASESSSAAADSVTPNDTDGQALTVVFGSPQRYVQGVGAIEQVGTHLAPMNIKRCVVLLTTRSQQAEGARLLKSLDDADIHADIATFGGECSFEEINRHTEALGQLADAPQALVALGGGKVVDAGKSIAHRLGLPVIVVPSLASNDAPCAAVSVIYTPEGVSETFEIFPENPALVLVDSAVVAAAPPRYLVAGMGDAMATWYEARACALNPQGITVFGARPTLAGSAIAELCARTIYADGEAALASVRAGQVDAAVERIVEANTLLSGLGYESGGLAVCHAVAQGYTVIDRVHRNHLHGEMVAMGVLTQLALEAWWDEADKAARFFARVGLPVHLGQIGLSPDDSEALDALVAASMDFPFITNMPFEVTADKLRGAVQGADELGRSVISRDGDEAYQALY